VLTETTVRRVAPTAGISIQHELADGIELERSVTADWVGTAETATPLVVRHERGDARPAAMTPVLHVSPWCTFHVDRRGEPACSFHAVFGEVDRLLSCEEPGQAYVVRYGAQPAAPVVSLQSELCAYAFAVAARGVGLIAHACAFVTTGGRGVLCPGVSGTGKTTLARLLQGHAPSARVLTDDRAVVTLDDRLTLWGSPWPGAAGIADGGSAPLSAVMFIRHGRVSSLRRIAPPDAFRRIVNTLSIPLWEPSRCGRALEIIDAMVSSAALVEATYPPTADAACWLSRAVETYSLGSDADR
jgi:hypothetical protein